MVNAYIGGFYVHMISTVSFLQPYWMFCIDLIYLLFLLHCLEALKSDYIIFNSMYIIAMDMKCGIISIQIRFAIFQS